MPASLRERAEWRRCDKDALLFAIGDCPKSIYFIVQGEARLRRHSPEGTEMVMQRARAQVERQGLRNAGDRVLHYLESECPSGRLHLSQTKKA